MPDSANVFIAHRHEDDAVLQAMRELLLSRNFSIRDASINSSRPNEAHDPVYIKTQILAPRIAWASTLVVLISPKTLDHWWVDWEIEYAHKLGRRIVGVWTHGAAECDIPEALDRYADAVVGWRADRIIDAITGVVNNYECSDGTARAPRQLARVTC